MMVRPSTSGSTSFVQETDADAVDNISNNEKKRKSSDRKDRRMIEAEIEANNSLNFAVNIQSLIMECETRISGFWKLQRLARVAAEYNIFDIDDDSSNSSSISFNSSSDNFFANTAPSRFRRRVKKEKLTVGSWLFLSSVQGGWNYATTKSFLKKEYGVKCLRSRTFSDRLAMGGGFKAIVKFRTSEELNRIVMSLRNRKITDKFIFLSFDKTPVPYDGSDTESEEETRLNPFSMIPKGI